MQTWDVFPNVTETFVKLSRYPVTVGEDDIRKLEEFVVLLYDKSSSQSSIGSARKDFFMQKNIQFDHLPPSKAALKEQILRAVYQAGIVWGQCLDQDAQLPSPELWGWSKKVDRTWAIHWTDRSPISEVCKELCKCSCKKECSGRCSCVKSNLQCTSMCSCLCLLDI